MLQYLPYLVFVGGTVQLIGAYSYIRDTIRGKTKPNRITWLLWSIAPFIGSAAAFASGVRWAVIPVFMSGFGPLTVFISSFVNKNSYWKLERFDYLCGFLSLLALILWGITKMPIIAIIFAIASDLLAGVPTILKSWKYPETENAAPFTTGLLASISSFAAVKMWNFSSIGFPIYLTLMNGLIAIIIYRRKIFPRVAK